MSITLPITNLKHLENLSFIFHVVRMLLLNITMLNMELKLYSVQIQNDSYCIWNDKEDIAVGLTLEQTLDFEFDGVKLRDFITTDDVEITERIM